MERIKRVKRNISRIKRWLKKGWITENRDYYVMLDYMEGELLELKAKI